MSIVVCEICDAYIDSDIDNDCFVEIGNPELHQIKTMCERCRDKYYEEFNWESPTGTP